MWSILFDMILFEHLQLYNLVKVFTMALYDIKLY